jgi:hypothetical protein
MEPSESPLYFSEDEDVQPFSFAVDLEDLSMFDLISVAQN